MRVQDLIRAVRNQLADTKEPYLWSTSELLTYLLDTLFEIYTVAQYRAGLTSELATQPNVKSYDVNGEVVRVYDRKHRFYLEPIPYSIYKDLPDVSGLPERFAYDNRVLYLYPKPDDVYEYWLSYRVFPVVLSIYDEIDFPNPELLKLGVIVRAYMKQDSEVFDERAYTKFRQEYGAQLAQFKARVVRDGNITMRSYIPEGLL